MTLPFASRWWTGCTSEQPLCGLNLLPTLLEQYVQWGAVLLFLHSNLHIRRMHDMLAACHSPACYFSQAPDSHGLPWVLEVP